MAGTITHKWDGTVLTVTSDSGTSSADLKGAKGDDGARGAVGACPTLSVNGKIGEVVLSADDVGAKDKNWMPTADDVGAAEKEHTHTAADVGAVSKTGDTMTGNLNVANGLQVRGNSWHSYGFQTADGTDRGSMMVSNNNVIHFNIMESGATCADRYSLPSPTAGKTADSWYTILTSKTPVTIAQGGTGATTASGACDSIGAVKKNGDTMTGDLHLVGKNVYANQFATNSTTDNPQFALIYGGNDSTTLQMNNPDWSSDNWLRLYKNSTVLGKPLEIGSGGTGGKTIGEAQSNLFEPQYIDDTNFNVLTLPNGFFHTEIEVSKDKNNFPYDSAATKAEIIVFGNRNGENGYYCVCVIEMWDGTIYINRRKWSTWSGWTKITPTAV